MTNKRTCEECGAELPANAPQGLCPRCLANMGMGVLHTAASPESDFQVERMGTLIGRYKLLEKIGEGGFGVVFMAEQVEPVQRKVALKIIKAGMDTKEVIARFEAERQAIALMDHPNIARALDAGATEAGRPFFVMELVRGIPITDYCDQANLATQERLQLFIKVCQAVQHAHQKGVIHRDLKPSNVLVTEHDGEPVPKVIDFGVAKALGHKLTEKTLFTAFHHLIGTPAYMSPEQAALSGLDIDTRADIYSLGVLLYELLTGVTPFDAETFRTAAMDEIRRMIRETEPPKPSTRLQTLGDKLTDVARHRRTEPAALSRLVRGDLDWIVMRCLEKDRKRRYETANGLAADVARHLNSEPVMARAPSNLYRFQKLVRRHRMAVAATGAVIAAVLIGLGVSTWLYVKEKETRQQIAIAEREQHRSRVQAEVNETKAKSEANRADEALALVEIQRAEEFFAANDSPTALAYLARVLHRNPSNEVAAARALSALTICRFAVGSPKPPEAESPVWSAHFSPDGRQLIRLRMIKGRGSVAWYADTNQPVSAVGTNALAAQPSNVPLHHQGGLWSAQFSPHGQRVVTASVDKTARIWDVRTSQPVVNTMRHEDGMRSALFSPDGQRIVTASYDSTARVWDANTGRPLTEPLKHKAWVWSARFSPDGQRVVTSTGARMALVWDAQTGELLTQLLGHEDQVFSAQFSPDGQRVVTASFDQTARIWNADTGQPIGEAMEHKGWVWSAQFSPDGQKVVTASFDGTARVWDANTGRPLTEPMRHEAQVVSAQFSPDGRLVVTASLDETAQVWDAEAARPVIPPMTHDGAIWSAQFSPDGRRVVTASADNTARVWDVKTGQPLTEPLRHNQEVRAAQFSPDGQRVVTASADNTALVWEVPDVSLPVPEWMPQLTEAIAEKRFNEQGITEPVPLTQFEAFKRQLADTTADDVWSRWARWFFADPAARTISPFSEITVPEHARRRIQEDAIQSLLGGEKLSSAIANDVLALQKKRFGDHSIEVAQCLNAIASLHEEKSELVLAETARREVLAILTELGSVRSPEVVEALHDLAEVLKKRGDVPGAHALHGQAIGITVTNRMRQTTEEADIASYRGDLYASFGLWKEASTDLARAAELQPTNHLHYFMLAPLLVELGDLTTYRKQSQAMLNQFAQTDDPVLAERTAKTCLLVPDGVDLQPASNLAEISLTRANAGHPDDLAYFQLVKALAEYRLGHSASALEWAQKSLLQGAHWAQPFNSTRELMTHAVQAMARHQLKQPAEAQSALNKAVEIMNRESPKRGGEAHGTLLVDWLTCDILLREAKALIEEDPSAPKEGK